MADPATTSGRAARWKAHNAERRKRIVTAAIRVIEAAAPDAELSVQKVADKAGLVRTVIYRHFDGKPELVRAVQAHIVGELREALDRAGLQLRRRVDPVEVDERGHADHLRERRRDEAVGAAARVPCPAYEDDAGGGHFKEPPLMLSDAQRLADRRDVEAEVAGADERAPAHHGAIADGSAVLRDPLTTRDDRGHVGRNEDDDLLDRHDDSQGEY